MIFQEHDDRVKVGAVIMPRADFLTIVPGHPPLDPYIGRHYDTSSQRHYVWDTNRRYRQIYPWGPADNVLGDLGRIESEWDTIRNSRKPAPETAREVFDAALERLRAKELEILSARIDTWIANGEVDNALVRDRNQLLTLLSNLPGG